MFAAPTIREVAVCPRAAVTDKQIRARVRTPVAVLTLKAVMYYSRFTLRYLQDWIDVGALTVVESD